MQIESCWRTQGLHGQAAENKPQAMAGEKISWKLQIYIYIYILKKKQNK